jgi:hypothetical protein
MRKVYVCAAILVLTVVFAAICEVYVMNTVRETAELLEQAAEIRRNGDYPRAAEYAESARIKWQELIDKSNFLLTDLTLVSDVTNALSRINSLAATDNSERFLEENAVAILLLGQFLSDNRNG